MLIFLLKQEINDMEWMYNSTLSEKCGAKPVKSAESYVFQ